MGYGFTLECSKCRYWIRIRGGIGFRYQEVCTQTLLDAQKGRYGGAMQQAAGFHAAAAYQEQCLLRCRDCGCLTAGQIIHICVPRDALLHPESPSPEDEMQHRLWVSRDAIGTQYVILESLQNHCPECGGNMDPVDPEDAGKTDCPLCRKTLSVTENFLWD